jgi:hypothetical protein
MYNTDEQHKKTTKMAYQEGYLKCDVFDGKRWI